MKLPSALERVAVRVLRWFAVTAWYVYRWALRMIGVKP
jgi:hypothetical protein